MFKPQYKQLIAIDGIYSNSSLLMCAKANIALSFAVLAIVSFPQLLKYQTNMVASYRVVS